MFAGIRRRLTYANVMATIAVFIALGGVTWAAATIDSGDVVNNSLKSVDLKDGQGVKAADVAPGELVTPGSEGWQPLDLYDNVELCHWVNYGAGFNPAGMLRDPAGFVHFRGLIKVVDGNSLACGQPDDAFLLNDYLPQGYRPANRELFSITSNGKPGRVDVLSNGMPQIEVGYPTFPDAKAWVSLDGISYRCAPSGQNG